MFLDDEVYKIFAFILNTFVNPNSQNICKESSPSLSFAKGEGEVFSWKTKWLLLFKIILFPSLSKRGEGDSPTSFLTKKIIWLKSRLNYFFWLKMNLKFEQKKEYEDNKDWSDKLIKLSNNTLNKKDAQKIINNFPDVLKKLDSDSLIFLLNNEHWKSILLNKKVKLGKEELLISDKMSLDKIYEFLSEIETYEELIRKTDEAKKLEIFVLSNSPEKFWKKFVSHREIVNNTDFFLNMSRVEWLDKTNELVDKIHKMRFDSLKLRFVGLSEVVLNNMAVWLNSAFLDTINKNPTAQKEFFTELWKLKTWSAVDVFSSMNSFLYKYQSVQNFTNAFNNLTTILQYPSNVKLIWNGEHCSGLINPSKFKNELFKHNSLQKLPSWSLDIKILGLENLLSWKSDYDFAGFDEKSREFKDLQNPVRGMVYTKEISGAINNLATFVNGVDKSKMSFKEQILSLWDLINGLSKWYKSIFREDFEKSSLGQTFDMILKFMWFANWFHGFKKEYLEKKLIISSTEKVQLKNWMDKNALDFAWTDNSTPFSIETSKPKYDMLDKLAFSSSTCSMDPKLLISLLSWTGLEKHGIVKKDAENKLTINSELFKKNSDKIYELFINQTNKVILDNSELKKGILEAKNPKTELLLAYWAVFLKWNDAIDWINLGIIQPENFIDKTVLAKLSEISKKPKETVETQNGKTQNITSQDKTENVSETVVSVDYDKKYIETLSKNKPNIDYLKDWQFNAYLRFLEKSNNLPTYSLSAMMQVESGGKNYDLNGNLIGSSAGAMGLFQFMPASVTGLYFDRSDPILWAKYAAQALKSQWIVQGKFDLPSSIARYNCWVWTYASCLGNQPVSSSNVYKLPLQTQQHLAQNLVYIDVANGVDYKSKRYYNLFKRVPGHEVLISDFLSRLPKNSNKDINLINLNVSKSKSTVDFNSKEFQEVMKNANKLDAEKLSEVWWIWDSIWDWISVFAWNSNIENLNKWLPPVYRNWIQINKLNSWQSLCSRELAANIDPVLRNAKTNWVKSFLIYAGTNDIWSFDLQKSKNAFIKMIEKSLAQNIQPVLSTIYYKHKNSELFNNMIREIVYKYRKIWKNVGLLDFENKRTEIMKNWLPDQHLTQAWYKSMVDLVVKPSLS